MLAPDLPRFPRGRFRGLDRQSRACPAPGGRPEKAFSGPSRRRDRWRFGPESTGPAPHPSDPPLLPHSPDQLPFDSPQRGFRRRRLRSRVRQPFCLSQRFHLEHTALAVLTTRRGTLMRGRTRVRPVLVPGAGLRWLARIRRAVSCFGLAVLFLPWPVHADAPGWTSSVRLPADEGSSVLPPAATLATGGADA